MGTKLIKESTETTITSAGVTIIDWLDVRSFASFILTIVNTGDNEIANIIVDSSIDGGVTIVEEAAVPDTDGSPAGYANKFDFELEVNYIRVRLVATDSDTTAIATLFGSEIAGSLCTLADIKERLALTDTKHNDQLNRIIASASTIFDSFCQRTFLNTGSITEYYSEASRFLQLKRWPIIEITSIKIALDYDFSSATALTENSDYRIMHSGRSGQLMHMFNSWYGESYPDSVEIVYEGGFCSAGEDAAEGEHELPADLREAAILQCCFIFQRRDAVGVKATSFNGGSMETHSPMGLLPMVKEILKKYRRPQL